MTSRLASFVLPVLLAGIGVFLAARLIDETRLLGPAAAVGIGNVGDEFAMALAPDAVPPQPIMPDPSVIAEVLGRPLFSPTRRPPVRVATAPAPEPSAPANLPEWQLHGIVVVGDARTALLADESRSRLQRVGTGDQVDGWHVLEIGADGVVLQRGDQTHLIRLNYQKETQ